MKKDTKSLLWGAVVGSVVGSVTALLFAPKPGKELRKDIAEGTASTLEKAQEIATQAGDKSVELYSKAKESVEQVVQEVREWTKQCTSAEDEEDKLVVSGITTEESVITVEADDINVNDTDVNNTDVNNTDVDDKDNNGIL
ncbi:YtxH domain-containing protein [Paenibacillus sp. 19GGS1-52]|uniref:YtxH domain-containing protein n=1 Tax=Paenibacillus sp. 19GGS1-52 TaxID=2758563 RepID=UPI001EFB2B48|nr:YtxH domain-containing protein [Paenibacillus sp. 19GGS1-52]ULO05743.1 YtxH domain-containing protein [Paenibacillus sp. 19GGS1-52]